MTLAAILVADLGERERGFLEEGGNFVGVGEKIFLKESQAC